MIQAIAIITASVGVPVTQKRRSPSLRRRTGTVRVSEWPAPDCSSAGATIQMSSENSRAILSSTLRPVALTPSSLVSRIRIAVAMTRCPESGNQVVGRGVGRFDQPGVSDPGSSRHERPPSPTPEGKAPPARPTGPPPRLKLASGAALRASRRRATRVAAAAPNRRIIGGAGTCVPPLEVELEVPPLEVELEVEAGCRARRARAGAGAGTGARRGRGAGRAEAARRDLRRSKSKSSCRRSKSSCRRSKSSCRRSRSSWPPDEMIDVDD